MGEKIILSVLCHPLMWNIRLEHYSDETSTNNVS